MKALWLWLGGCLLLAAGPCFSADVGIVTVLDGKPRILRGTTWYKLAEGGAVRDGDVVDAPDNAQFQLELSDGGAVSVIGPGALYVVSYAPRDPKQAALAEFMLTRGWFKFTTKTATTRLRIRSPLGTVTATNATAVARVTPDAMEVFVETGIAKLMEPGKLGGDTTAGDLRDGGFAARTAGKPFAIAARAPSQFVAALPRDFMDPLPSRIGRFKSGPIELAVDREATYVDAQSWFAGPYRAAFLKRFEPKLADPAFRAAAAANSKTTPEWSALPPPAATPAVPVKAAEAPKEKAAEPERTWRWPWESNKK
jgi:hypothetical protein